MEPLDLSAAEQIIVSGLDDMIVARALRHRELVRFRGIPFVFISGRRGYDHQAALHADYERRRAEWIAQGRPGTEPRPAAAPGGSFHELGLAYDFTGPRTAAEWVEAGELAEALGLESGHRYDDAGHVELPGTIEAAKAMLRLRLFALAAVLGLGAVVAGGGR